MDDHTQTAAAVANAEACIARGHYDDAVRALSAFPRNFVPGHLKCIDLFTSIVFKTISESHLVDYFNYLRRIRGKLNSSADPEKMLEAIAELILKNIRLKLDEATTNVKSTIENSTERDTDFAIITGVPLNVRAKDRFFLLCLPIINKIAVDVFFGPTSLLTSSKNILHVYCTTACQFISLCVDYELDKTLERIAESVFRTFQRILLESEFYKGHKSSNVEREIRERFYATTSAGEEVISMLSNLAEQLSVRGCWKHLWNIVSITKKISAQFESPSVVVLAFDSIAKTFWTCKQCDFHAYFLSRLAQIDPAKYATRAIIAALCTRDFEKEYNPFEINPSNINSRNTISSGLDDPETNTEALLSRLLVPRITHHADPIVLKLVQELRHPIEYTNYRCVRNYVENIFLPSSPLYPTVAQYQTVILQALLHREIEQISRQHNRVDLITELTMINSSILTDKEYVEFVEPLILKDAGVVPVDIDSKNRCVTFHHSATKKLHNCFNMLGSMLIDRPGCETVEREDHLGVKYTLPSTLPSISISDLRMEAERARLFYKLQAECCGTKENRKKRREEIMEEEKAETKQKLIDAEKEKQEKLLKARLNIRAVERKEARRQEGLRTILHLLTKKYPGVKFDPALCTKATAAFEDEVTQILANFKRQKAENNDKETLSQHLLERALRRLEIPKRKEFNERNEEIHKAEHAAARENYLLQHRKDYERRANERMALRKFKRDADAFERDIINLSIKEKSSKRDEQQFLLEQEMERLANQ